MMFKTLCFAGDIYLKPQHNNAMQPTANSVAFMREACC